MDPAAREGEGERVKLFICVFCRIRTGYRGLRDLEK